MTPEVSVIIPAYNGAKFLSRSIEGVINQTFTNWELIIVDDGSTDNSKDIISEYVHKDNRITYYWQANSGTPAKPKNTAFTHVRGKYVAYLDQDDEWVPEKLERQLAVFAKYQDEKIGIVSCGAHSVSEDGSPKAVPPVGKENVSLADLLHYNYIFSNSSVMLPASVIQAIGDRDESKEISYFEDWDMWVRVLAGGYTVRTIDEPLFNYSTHADNMSRVTAKLKQAEMLVAFYHKHIKLYEDNKVAHIFLKTIGLYYALAGESAKAREYYKKSISSKKTYVAPYSMLALTYIGATDTALKCWRFFK